MRPREALGAPIRQSKVRFRVVRRSPPTSLEASCGIPHTYQYRLVALDTLLVKVGQDTIPVLIAVDLGTNFQVATVLPDHSSHEVALAFQHKWVQYFGLPEVVVTDGGQWGLRAHHRAERSAAFDLECRLPWENGGAERRSGLLKDVLETGSSWRLRWPRPRARINECSTAAGHPRRSLSSAPIPGSPLI